MKRLSWRFLRSSLVLFLCVLSILCIGILAPSDAHAFGSLTENGTAAFMGIGVNPTRILHVSGTGPGSVPLFQRGSDSAGFIIERTPTNRWVLGVNESPTLGNGFVLSTIPTGTTSVPRLMISPQGRVGIGTVSPDTLSRLHVLNTDNTSSARAIYGETLGNGTYGVYGKNTNTSGGYGVFGTAGEFGQAVRGENPASGTSGYIGGPSWAVAGERSDAKGRLGGTGGDGVYGESSHGNASGVYGTYTGSGEGTAVYGLYGPWGAGGPSGYLGSRNYGVYGQSSNGNYGYLGDNATGVAGYHSNGNFGRLGDSDRGVYGNSVSKYGVAGNSSTGTGTYGYSGYSRGVSGYSLTNIGVYGKSDNISSYAGYFQGNAYVTDNLTAGSYVRGTGVCINGDCRTDWPSGGGLPSGTENQTLRYDGSNWVASSLLYNDGTSVGIGTTSPTAGKLDVRTASGSSVYSETGSSSGYGMIGKNTNSTSGAGVYGEAAGNSGIAPGVMGKNTFSNNTGLIGGILYGARGDHSSGNFGYLGSESYGVYGKSLNSAGVYGETSSGADSAIYGVNTSSTDYGSLGNGGQGVYGNSGTGSGVLGESTSGYGVHGKSVSGYAGYFEGNVLITENLTVTGTLTKGVDNFKIDHPQYPENMYLVHSVIESPDMKNVYDGTTVLDGKGEAVVQLPSYFEALNRDFRYQLTAIGAPGPDLYIAREVSGGSFAIAGGKPGMKVSWQVTGIRQDAFARAHPLVVEQDKSATEKGYYLHPAEWGQPAEKGISSLHK